MDFRAFTRRFWRILQVNSTAGCSFIIGYIIEIPFRGPVHAQFFVICLHSTILGHCQRLLVRLSRNSMIYASVHEMLMVSYGDYVDRARKATRLFHSLHLPALHRPSARYGSSSTNWRPISSTKPNKEPIQPRGTLPNITT